MNKPKISVITWNGGFRESFHTVDFFQQQTFAKEYYEFIWVEYNSFADSLLVQKIQEMANGKIVLLAGKDDWHAGRCMNAGISNSYGELLVIIDGDIAVKPDFLEKVWQAHVNQSNLVIYFRRWDEPKEQHIPNKSHKSIVHLENVCQFQGPENYGGCISIRRDIIEQVKGYEEHPIFSGASAVSKELYTRLRNVGLPIIWHPTEKVFHPWHIGTIPSYNTPEVRKQQWLIRQRSLNIDTQANWEQVNTYLASYPETKPSPENQVNPSSSFTLLNQLRSQLKHVFKQDGGQNRRR